MRAINISGGDRRAYYIPGNSMSKQIDKLTGLISESELKDEMDALIAGGGDFAFIVFDIDNLMPTNRDFGNEAGDALIRMIADCVKKLFPAPCMGFRRGDEFEILVPGGSKESAFLKAEELRKMIAETKLDFKSPDGRAMSSTVSGGVSSYPEDGARTADILRRADSAMMRAKKSDRNMVCLAREEKLVPKPSHYTQAQLDQLSLISRNINVVEAALMREALDDLLKKYDIDEMHKTHILRHRAGE